MACASLLDVSPLAFTATQRPGVEHETSAVATAPPGKTSVGDDQPVPALQEAASPPRPSTVHDDVVGHDTERGRSVSRPVTADVADHRPLLKVAVALGVSPMQNELDGHDTAQSPGGPPVTDQVPSRST